MRKKWIRLVLAVMAILSLAGLPALAEKENAGLVIEEQTFTQREGGNGAHYFARVENKGDSEMAVGRINLSVFGAEDMLLASTEYIASVPYALKLKPGEYVYVYNALYDEKLAESKVVDIKAELVPADLLNAFRVEPCEGTYVEQHHGSLTDAEIHVTYTNQGKALTSDFTVVAALYSKEGKLLFVGDRAIASVDVHPGSTLTVRVGIPFELVEKWAADGAAVDRVDAIFYIRDMQ